MNAFQRYVLLLGPGCDDPQTVRTLLHDNHACLRMARSPDQAMAQVAESSPYLVILSGSQNRSKPFVQYLRQSVYPRQVTVVALVESNEPDWQSQEDYPELDGILIEPLSPDVVTAVFASALAKTNPAVVEYDQN